MPHPEPRPRPSLSRADLPAELTPETVRHLDLRTLRLLSRPGNGVLGPEDQGRFDAALAEVTRATESLVEESLRRAQHGGPGNLDPAMRRSYQRTQQRLAEQARRARRSLPAPDPVTPDPVTPDPATEDVSPDTLEEQVAQTSETLDMLERIASLQQQQVEHQHSQLLSETRGFFFAFLVSVAVIIAGVAPLVEAEPHERLLIIVWTVVATAVAGVVYALVRAVQVRKKPDPGP